MKNKIQVGILFVVLTLGAASVFADNSSKSISITPKIGFSSFTGILGLEVQYNHLALDVGYIPSGGLRYYWHPDGHSWFAGAFGSGYGYDHDETKDGIAYTHYSMIQSGIGGGYRWLWHRRWSLELGLTVGAGKQHWTNYYAERTENDIFFLPIVAGGISF